MKRNIKGDLVYYTFDRFDETSIVSHAFSTRLGGVSGGHFSSLNLGFSRGDDYENVSNNYEVLCDALEINIENLVFSAQAHTTNVVRVSEADRGNGIKRKNKFREIDGLITNEPLTALVTFYADCIPIFLLDPVKKVIGISHSGWRGTLNKIAEKTINKMEEEFGSSPEDILAGIGPGIGPCCFETDEPVFSLFMREYSSNVSHKGNGKATIDLWEINREILINSGVKRYNIEVAGVCTKCNTDEFYSHRKHGANRGSMAAIMELKI